MNSTAKHTHINVSDLDLKAAIYWNARNAMKTILCFSRILNFDQDTQFLIKNYTLPFSRMAFI